MAKVMQSRIKIPNVYKRARVFLGLTSTNTINE